MLRSVNLPVITFATIAALICGSEGASAHCQIISATHSALTREGAVESSQMLALEKALDIQRQNGWRSYSMRARKVRPDPFWKAVRPIVPAEAIVGGPIVTPRTHTVCWTGVVVPYVCTSGTLVCSD
jgi:hypothetical protein